VVPAGVTIKFAFIHHRPLRMNSLMPAPDLLSIVLAEFGATLRNSSTRLESLA